MENYGDHIIAFVDFLGFKEALRDPERTEKLLRLLKHVAELKGEFSIQSKDDGSGGKQTLVRPAISVASDNVIISYPASELKEHGLAAVIPATMMSRLIAYVAWNGFESRLLVRGGVAFGPLYHSGDVVFGPALVDAYETEREVAIYPRIALSPSMSNMPDFDKWKHNFPVADDGARLLPYMADFILRMSPGIGHFNMHVKPWMAEVRAVVKQERETLAGN